MSSTTKPSWSAGAIGATFASAPVTASASTTPARSFPSVLRLAKGLHKTKAVHGEQARQQKSGKLGTTLLSILMVMLLVAAGLLVWKAFAVDVADSVEAPLPAGEFAKPAGEPVGPTGDDPVDVDGVTMTAASMGPNTLFIPALSVYMPLEASETFVSSRYSGFDTLKVPKNPRHGVYYEGGAGLYGGQAGVTMIASHVSSSTGWGALRYLYTLTGGEMIYTKDADGQLQSWQLTEMRVEEHTAFPQEYWSPEGDRYLVITTCGGGITADGNYKKNIFAVAVPVDPLPMTAEQLEEESAAEEAELQIEADVAA